MEDPPSPLKRASTRTAPPRCAGLAFTGGSFIREATSSAECGCGRLRCARKIGRGRPNDGAPGDRLRESERDCARIGAWAWAQSRGRDRGRDDPRKLVEASESIADFSVLTRSPRFE